MVFLIFASIPSNILLVGKDIGYLGKDVKSGFGSISNSFEVASEADLATLLIESDEDLLESIFLSSEVRAESFGICKANKDNTFDN